MDRCAKGFRVVSGFLLLLNLVAFFLPVTNRLQENYATINWSQLDYITNMLQKNLPHGTEAPVAISTEQTMVIIFLMIFPIVLSLIAGIYGIVGSSKQIVSSILSFLIAGIYIGLLVGVSALWPQAQNGQFYEKGIGCMLAIGASGCSVVTSIIALIVTPRNKKTVSGEIPQVAEIRQEQIQAKYNIIPDVEKESQKGIQQSEQQMIPQQEIQQTNPQPQEIQQTNPQQPEIPEYVPGEPRGVMVGLTGMYAGAQISFADGESIKLGRLPDNDLVFENQPKVSRNHCQIKWDATRKKFSYLDYSSNGSFVNGSDDCLPQNIEMWLPVGTVVAIGDEENTFRLE